MGRETVQLAAGDDTQELVEYIFNNLGDEMVDEIAFEQEHARSTGLASEAVLVAATLTLSATALLAVARLVERWLENKREEGHMEIVLKAVAVSDEAGRILADLAKTHASVSIAYGAISPNRTAGGDGTG